MTGTQLAGGYAVTAEFYSIMAEPTWETKLGPAVARALANFDPGDDWIIDIGAGTGLSTAAILRAVPNARVLAIEPEPTMRAALMTRVALDPLLRTRVSVIPTKIFEADLPPCFAAATIISTVHHFGPVERTRLWAMLAERLIPGGVAVVEIQIPANDPLPETRNLVTRVGDIDYEGWIKADPVGPGLQRFWVGYRSFRAGRVLDDQSTSYDMHVAGFNDVESEAAAAGLSTVRQGDLLLLIKAKR